MIFSMSTTLLYLTHIDFTFICGITLFHAFSKKVFFYGCLLYFSIDPYIHAKLLTGIFSFIKLSYVHNV